MRRSDRSRPGVRRDEQRLAAALVIRALPPNTNRHQTKPTSDLDAGIRPTPTSGGGVAWSSMLLHPDIDRGRTGVAQTLRRLLGDLRMAQTLCLLLGHIRVGEA